MPPRGHPAHPEMNPFGPPVWKTPAQAASILARAAEAEKRSRARMEQQDAERRSMVQRWEDWRLGLSDPSGLVTGRDAARLCGELDPQDTPNGKGGLTRYFGFSYKPLTSIRARRFQHCWNVACGPSNFPHSLNVAVVGSRGHVGRVNLRKGKYVVRWFRPTTPLPADMRAGLVQALRVARKTVL